MLEANGNLMSKIGNIDFYYSFIMALFFGSKND